MTSIPSLPYLPPLNISNPANLAEHAAVAGMDLANHPASTVKASLSAFNPMRIVFVVLGIGLILIGASMFRSVKTVIEQAGNVAKSAALAG